MFFPPLKWTFNFFDIHLIMLKNQKFSIHQFYCWFNCVGYHLKDIQIVVLFSSLINNTPFKFNQSMKIIMTLKKIRNKDFVSYFSMMAFLCSRPISENTRQRVLNLGSNIKKNIYWTFFFSYFFKKERKQSKTPTTSFLCWKPNMIIQEKICIFLF